MLKAIRYIAMATVALPVAAVAGVGGALGFWHVLMVKLQPLVTAIVAGLAQ